MRLEDIGPEFLSLSNDDALKLIMSIRASRRISKRPVVEAKPKSPTNGNKKQTTLSIDAMTPEMAAMLLQKLKGKGL